MLITTQMSGKFTVTVNNKCNSRCNSGLLHFRCLFSMVYDKCNSVTVILTNSREIFFIFKSMSILKGKR